MRDLLPGPRLTAIPAVLRRQGTALVLDPRPYTAQREITLAAGDCLYVPRGVPRGVEWRPRGTGLAEREGTEEPRGTPRVCVTSYEKSESGLGACVCHGCRAHSVSRAFVCSTLHTHTDPQPHLTDTVTQVRVDWFMALRDLVCRVRVQPSRMTRAELASDLNRGTSGDAGITFAASTVGASLEILEIRRQ